MQTSHDIVISGLGALSPEGFGLDAHWQAVTDPRAKTQPSDHSLDAVQVRDYISDRRMLKAISHLDGIGLAAIVGLKQHIAYQADRYDPYRVGLYVGSVPSSLASFDPYLETMQVPHSKNSFVSVKEFGQTSQRSRPMTLLVGLLNNVLCYGSMLLEARGPNSNYTSLCLGAHHALIQGAWRLRRQQLDLAISGGYTSRAHPADQASLAQHGLVYPAEPGNEWRLQPFASQQNQEGFLFADMAAFVSLERRAKVSERGGSILGTYCGGAITSDGLGLMRFDPSGEGLERAIHGALREAKVSWQQIGLIFAAAPGFEGLETMEAQVLTRLAEKSSEAPALACTSAVFGSGMEAGGILELGLIGKLYDAGHIPGILRPARPVAGFGTAVDPHKPYSLILRTSPWGEYSCVVIRKD